MCEKWKRIYDDADVKNSYLSYFREWNGKINAFLQFDLDRNFEAPADDPDDGSGGGPAGAGFTDVPFAVKDNIAVQGFQLTCGSKILEGLVSPYTATAAAKLLRAGSRVVGKTNLDEFGMGSSNENSAWGPAHNPWDLARVTGGSSGGSAAAVAAGLVPFALGTDTGGSIRQPAAFCGVYGLKPTYGTVSRYGLVAYASSLEVIGVLSRDPETAAGVFEIIKGKDPLDHSSVDHTPEGPEKRVKRIGYLPENRLDVQEGVKRQYRYCIGKLESLGYETVEVDLPALEYTVPAYYTIATAEASSNLARYNGIRYGRRPGGTVDPRPGGGEADRMPGGTDGRRPGGPAGNHGGAGADSYEELILKARSEGFGEEVKLRVLLGTYVLRSGFQEQYYIRAQKIRTAIRRGFAECFDRVDLLCMPVFPTNAFPHGEAGLTPFQQKLADIYTSSANLAGIPALAFPTGIEEGVPAGMQLLAPPFEERLLFQTARKWHAEHPPAACPGYSEEWSV
jgi:aspartyl-tRNA(Asn)/glutamyl-tRNA(Gln) amidotransferase subunit A